MPCQFSSHISIKSFISIGCTQDLCLSSGFREIFHDKAPFWKCVKIPQTKVKGKEDKEKDRRNNSRKYLLKNQFLCPILMIIWTFMVGLSKDREHLENKMPGLNPRHIAFFLSQLWREETGAPSVTTGVSGATNSSKPSTTGTLQVLARYNADTALL